MPRSALVRFLRALSVALAFSTAASAAPLGAPPKRSEPAAGRSGGYAAAMERVRERIAAAPSAEEAREIALGETALAGGALDAALWLAPEDGEVAQARERLDAFEASLREAETAAQVAQRFDGIVRFAGAADAAGLYGDVEVDQMEVKIGDNICHYSTGELVVIIVGFILAIIPGIIFLFLLC